MESLLDLSEPELGELFALARRALRFLVLIYKTDSFNLALQEREAAGQSQPHLHIHLLPRSNGDLSSPGAWYAALQESESSKTVLDVSRRVRLTAEQLKEITADMRKEIHGLNL